MPRYQSRRHQKLMDESEFALNNASDSSSARVSRIISSILQDSRTYQLWESQHAELMLPVAEQSNKKNQIVELRIAEIRLVHQRALFKSLQESQLRGEERQRLFRIFHNSLDYHASVIAEHQHYRLAVSSRVSADHLIDVMHDPVSKKMLKQYERMYARYFEMKCYVAGMGHSNCIELVRSMMVDTYDQLRQLRRRIEAEAPSSDCGNFDRQEALARSGRYPVLNYMVG